MTRRSRLFQVHPDLSGRDRRDPRAVPAPDYLVPPALRRAARCRSCPTRDSISCGRNSAPTSIISPPASIPQQDATAAPMDEPQTLVQVYLSVAEQRNGRWTQKRMTPRPIVEVDSRLVNESEFTLMPCDFTWLAEGPLLLVPGSPHRAPRHRRRAPGGA